MESSISRRFERLDIAYKLYQHQKMYTVADAEKVSFDTDVLEIKNLFLRNKNKSQYYLISLPADTIISLSDLAVLTGNKRLSFASEADLRMKLGVYPGAVSILNAFNDVEKCVIYYISESILQHGHVAYHPNQNDQTIVFNGAEIPKLLKEYQVVIMPTINNS